MLAAHRFICWLRGLIGYLLSTALGGLCSLAVFTFAMGLHFLVTFKEELSEER